MKDDLVNLISKKVGLAIAKQRTLHGVSQQKLASDIGLTRTAIVKIESGRQRIPIDQLYLLAKAMEIKIHELIPAEIEEIKTTSLIEIARNRLPKEQKEKINKLLE